MDIVFSANNREEVIVFPYTPADIEIVSEQNNELYDGLTQTLNLIGKVGLKTLEISGMWFKHNPSFVNTDAADAEKCIEFFGKWRAKHVPVRLVISHRDGREWLNMACTVDRFSYAIGKSGDTAYSLSVTEYTFIGR